MIIQSHKRNIAKGNTIRKTLNQKRYQGKKNQGKKSFNEVKKLCQANEARAMLYLNSMSWLPL